MLRAFTDYSGSTEHLIVRDIRGPRTLLAVCVGAALGTAGALVQTLTRNPLAEPGILGVTGGAGFAVTVGAALGVAGSQVTQLLLAFVGAVIAAVVVYSVGRTSPLRLVLAGTALSSLLAGLSLGMRLLSRTSSTSSASGTSAPSPGESSRRSSSRWPCCSSPWSEPWR